MSAYFQALRKAGIHGTFIASGDSLYIIRTGIDWEKPKPANDNG